MFPEIEDAPINSEDVYPVPETIMAKKLNDWPEFAVRPKSATFIVRTFPVPTPPAPKPPSKAVVL